MSSGNWPETADICSIFREETVDAGGTVTDTFDDGNRLFIRSVIPGFNEIIPGDSVKGGVALRSNSEEIWIHPYILRVICANGSIRPLAIQSTHIVRQESVESLRTRHDFLPYLRKAIRRCLDRQVIQAGVEEMRTARTKGLESAVRMLQTVEYLHASISSTRLRKIAPELIAEAMGESRRRIDSRSRLIIRQRFHRDEVPSLYGLMNAVTSVARDSRDPEERWLLEEYGGLVPLLPRPLDDLTRDHAFPPRSVSRTIIESWPAHVDKEAPSPFDFDEPVREGVAESLCRG